jgi:ribonuclease D
MAKCKFENNSTDKCLPFHFDIPFSHLKWVDTDTPNVLESFVDALENVVIVGIDTETKPNFKRGECANPTALMQIALRSSSGIELVFLLDLLSLMSGVLKDVVDRALIGLFSNEKVIKIGQGLSQDLRELRDSYPSSSAFREMRSVIDTNVFHRHLQPTVLQNVSLKNFTRMYLHLNLVKSQQMTNWSKRPLTDSQVS